MCSHVTTTTINIETPPKRSLSPSCRKSPPSAAPPWAITSLISATHTAFSRISYKRNHAVGMKFLPHLPSLTELNALPSIICCVSLYVTDHCSVVRMCGFVSKAAVNMCLPVCFHFSSKTLGVGLLGHVLRVCLTP